MRAEGESPGAPLKSFLLDAEKTLDQIGLVPPDQPLSAGELTVAQLRRRRRTAEGDLTPGYLTLFEDDNGVLYWETDVGERTPRAGASMPGRRRARRRGLTSVGRVLDEKKFVPVEGSEVSSVLARLDRHLNPHLDPGIETLKGKIREADGSAEAQPKPGGRILLFVHGTFSHCDQMLEALGSVEERKLLLKRVRKHYDQVLCFEHPTLAVSPFLNALDLARAFGAAQPHSIDVVCHSRGGLVVRWWLEILDAAAGANARVVFVGSPLQGTCLASPRRLRSSLNYLANVSVALRDVAGLMLGAVPLYQAAAGLMTVVGSVMSVGAKSPLVDAAVALVPGLAAQARLGGVGDKYLTGNFELERLSAGTTQVPSGYSFVKADFEPPSEGWRFWRYFMKAGEHVSDAGAELVFDGEANDLVVDCASMDRLSKTVVANGGQVQDLRRGPIHHLNYFSERKTLDFILERFGIS